MKAVTKIIFLDDEGEKFFGEGPARLMHAIEETGSLRAAAISMNMAYTKALKLIRNAEAALDFSLIHRQTGGKDGGTVFYRHTDDTRLEIRCHLELVADSGAEHVARRHLSGFCLSAYASHCGIGGAIGELAVDEK